MEKHVTLWEGHESIRLRFQLRTGSAGLLEDESRCQRRVDDRHVLCNTRDVRHIVLEYKESCQ